MSGDGSRTSNRNASILAHYHDSASRVFCNGGRPNENLHNIFLGAAKNGEYERVWNFLNRSARNLPVNVDYKDKQTGNTAIILAASNNHHKVVSLLLNYGADITLCNESGHSVLDMAPKSLIPLLLSSVERQGTSSRHLLQAAWQGNIEILKRLLSSPAKLDVNCKNADGLTPLLLVTRDISLFERIEKALDSGYNPVEVVQELLHHQVNCEISSTDGKQPLHQIATNKGRTAERVARLLVDEGGCDANAPDGFNYSPAHWASKEDNWPVLLALIEGGADVNARGHGGKTPLHVAASHGHEHSSNALLAHGADMTIVDDRGYSPMEVTASKPVKHILREAWAEQTSKAKQRMNSAPGLFQESGIKIQYTDDEESFSVTSERKLSKQPRLETPDSSHSNRSVGQLSSKPETVVPRLTTSKSKALIPTPPKKSSRCKQIKYKTYLSRSNSDSVLRPDQRKMELPLLAVKNIELHLVRTPRSGLNHPLTQEYAQACNPVVQRYRLLNRHSAPIPPEYNCTRSLPATPSTPPRYGLKGMGTNHRVKLPSLIAPPPGRRASSPDVRLIVNQGGVQEDSGLTCIGEVIDLDSLRGGGSISKSLVNILYPEERENSCPPPPSLSDTPRDTSFSNMSLRTSDDENSIQESHQDKSGKNSDDTEAREQSSDNSEVQRSSEKSILATSDALLTRTLSTETQQEVGVSRSDASSPYLSKDSCLEDNHVCHTQTFTSEYRPCFWVPYMDGKNADEKENCTEEKKTKSRSDSSSSSTSFFVDLNSMDEKSSPVFCLCGNKIPDTDTSLVNSNDTAKCEMCTAKSTNTNSFWVSLENGNCQEQGIVKDTGNPTSNSCEEEDSQNIANSSQINEELRKARSATFVIVSKGGKAADNSSLPVVDEVRDQQGHAPSSTIVTGEQHTRLAGDEVGHAPSSTIVTGKQHTRLAGDEAGHAPSSTIVTGEQHTSLAGHEAGHAPSSTIVADEQHTRLAGDEAGETTSQCSMTENSNPTEQDNAACSTEVTSENETISDRQSSLVLQSFSADNVEQSSVQSSLLTDERTEEETTGIPDTTEQSVNTSSSENPSKTMIARYLNDTVIPNRPICAWSTPRQEDNLSGVQICNPFPSPVPPNTVIPEVLPPIGGHSSGFIKKPSKKVRGSKEVRARQASRSAKKQKVKGTKESSGGTKKGKKGKGKKKGGCKEIEVNQSAANLAGYGAGVARATFGGVVCDVPEHIPSPDVDAVPTLCLDPRTFNARPVRGKFQVLSPIPESPRSVLSSPRSIKIPTTIPEKSTESLDEEGASLDKLISYLDEAERQIDNPRDQQTIHSSPSNIEISVESGEEDTKENHEHQEEGACDEVDGGLFSRFVGLCIPQLNLNVYDSDSDGESSEPFIDTQKVISIDQQMQEEQHDVNDEETLRQDATPARLPDDEADDEIESMVHGMLSNAELASEERGIEMPSEVCTASITRQQSCHTASITRQESCHTDQTTPSSDADKLTDEPRGIGDKRASDDRNDNEAVQQTQTQEYVNEVNKLFEYENQDTLTSISSLSRNRPNLLEAFSDNDSSYNSFESTPRAVSNCSSHESSSDSYFSSPRDSTSHLSTHTYEEESSSSLEIQFNERMFTRQMSTDTCSNSGSSDSTSTFRAPYRDKKDTIHSSLSESTRSDLLKRRRSQSIAESQASVSSRGEEIEWQRGNILGKGGFGTVYLGLVNTGEMIAVKQVELHPNNVDEAEKQYDKLQEEIWLLKSLKHKNIVRYIGTYLDETQWTIHIFMEYVPGGSIAQALKRFGALVEPVFCRYTKQILNGVAYLHDNNVIHRDIKGGNIMLMPNGVIKLIDFGCAKKICMNLSLSKSDILRSMKGTPYWMAPEVVRETGHGRKSDIWSVGCTVFEMATSQPPWSDMPPLSAIFAIGSGSPVPQLNESFSQRARDFVSTCMTRDPEARPSADELLLHEFLNGSP